MNNRLPVILAAALLLTASIWVPAGCAKPPPLPENRAAIVDQLEQFEPDAALVERVTTILTGSNLKVDYFHGEEITVDFYRKLAGQGYKFILLRSHAGLLGSGEKAIPRTCIFTSEPYTESKHLSEQMTDQLAKARIDAGKPWVFAIGATFVDRSMQGRYNGTLFLMMGCSSLYFTDLAETLVKKGVSACIGWDASIGAEYMDRATLSLVEKIYRQKLSVEKAVAETTQETGPDPDFGGALKYYPAWSGPLVFAAPGK